MNIELLKCLFIKAIAPASTGREALLSPNKLHYWCVSLHHMPHIVSSAPTYGHPCGRNFVIFQKKMKFALEEWEIAFEKKAGC